jgi:site-specific DNA-methyltransferase (cytosine-N4-specific)
LHEYRGKFNPQIVRAVGNIIGIVNGEWILDPFCGCGTTLLEAAHMGWNAIGLDLNPLGVEITQAKIAAMRVPVADLLDGRKVLYQRLGVFVRGRSFNKPFTREETRSIAGKAWQETLPSIDYLKSWFTESVLAQLWAITNAIETISSKEVRLISRMILSDVLRGVSLQEPADLRIRRRKSPPENEPAIPLFLAAVTRKIDAILRARLHVSPLPQTVQKAFLADARQGASELRDGLKAIGSGFRAAITSPPYATALPYVDTQRLSLVFFGLISSAEIRATERDLIGNREITGKERLKIENVIKTEGGENLPKACIGLCRRLLKSVSLKDGFRRQNVPSLVFKYFVDMAAVMHQVYELLQPQGVFAMIIGSNRTKLGGKTFLIDTPRLLAKIAEVKGFSVQEVIPLNTYQRFDIHRANSIRSESMILLRR